MPKVFIIAEAGVNHNGSLAIAKELISAAADSGVDAVKFQTFKSGSLVSKSAPKAPYQARGSGGGTQLEMIRPLELGIDAHRELIKYSRSKGLIFISSPFDLDSVGLLAKLGLGIIKIPSGEINNLPYLRRIGSLKKRIILSTGMSDLKEIKMALEILVRAGTKKENITVLHCNSEYPTPMKDVNLMAMLAIRDKLGVAVGYSDHTLGMEVAIAAAALGASVIEKHFTLDRHMRGPDHQASLEPDELKRMVKMIRNIETALGSSEKKPTGSEKKNLRIVRKSIVAARPIKKGERFGKGNITTKRPGFGLSPMMWDAVVGKKAKYDFNTEDLIKI